MPATSQASLMPNSCLSDLDEAVNLYNNGNSKRAATLLKVLENSCSHLPQVHHNLGVIAGIRQQWQQANDHFKRAIADDERTNMTRHQLQAIHQYKSSLAYRKALGVTGAVDLPVLTMQNSAHINSEQKGQPKSTLHDAPTIDYELYSWWTAAANESMPSWLEHYATGYPPLENTDARTVRWDSVVRDISFTAQDAVVVLRYQIGESVKRTLLLLRLQNNRWKIYKESVL